ncbi:hypothetical protein V8E36_001925 [Tilletia maclaganii]
MPSAPTSATAYRSHMQNGSVALSAPYYEFSTSVSASPSGPPSGSTTDHLGNHIFIDIGTRSTASPTQAAYTHPSSVVLSIHLAHLPPPSPNPFLARARLHLLSRTHTDRSPQWKDKEPAKPAALAEADPKPSAESAPPPVPAAPPPAVGAPKPAPRGYDARVAANASASGDEEDSASAAGRFAPTTRGPAANSAPAPIVSQAPLVFGLDYAANDATLSIPGSKFPSCIIPFGASNHASTILGASAIRPLPGTQGKLTSPGPRTAL